MVTGNGTGLDTGRPTGKGIIRRNASVGQGWGRKHGQRRRRGHGRDTDTDMDIKWHGREAYSSAHCTDNGSLCITDAKLVTEHQLYLNTKANVMREAHDGEIQYNYGILAPPPPPPPIFNSLKLISV